MNPKTKIKITFGVTISVLLLLVLCVPLIILYTDKRTNHKVPKNSTLLPLMQNVSATLPANCDNCIMDSKTKIKSNINIRILGMTTACQYTGSCNIRCLGGTLAQVIQDIEYLSETVSDCFSNYQLVFEKTQFPSNTLNYGWLGNITIPIGMLTMTSVNLKELGDEVFSGTAFETPFYLSLVDTKIRNFRKNTFKNSLLASLTIDFYSLTHTSIEEDLLSSTAQTIEYISFTCSMTDDAALENLMGADSYFINLQALYLRYNSFQNLREELFSNAPYLRVLYLSFSGIKQIDANAFHGLSALELLDISNNNLETLHDGTFSSIENTIRDHVSIVNNPLKCNCSVKWLKDFLEVHKVEKWPECIEDTSWSGIEELDCPTVTLPSLEPTSVTPHGGDKFVFTSILCRNLQSFPFDQPDDTTILLQTAIFKKRDLQYNIYEIENSSKFVLQVLSILGKNEYVVWANVEDQDDYGCVYDIDTNVIMDMSFESLYSICIASNDTVDQYAISAEDCTAFATPLQWEHRVWLNNQQKLFVLICSVCTFLVVLCLSSAFTYCIIRKKPELIKGNKRVIIVRKNKNGRDLSKPHDVPILNKYHDRRISTQSLTTNLEGYLTPRLVASEYSKWYSKNYERIKYMKQMDEDKYNKVYEAPPLPPNHPLELRTSKEF